MEAKMDLLELEENSEYQPSLEASLASDVMYDDSPVCPCIGSEHQAEIPNLVSEDERQHLMNSPLNSHVVLGYDYPIVVGLAIPITWASPREVNKENEELRRQLSSETEEGARSRDEESQVASVCPTSNNTSECDSTCQDAHPVVRVNQTESESNQVPSEILAPCSTREKVNFSSKPMMQQEEIKQFIPLPDSPTVLWSDIESECFLLGLYIFGKNLSLLSRFLGTKTVGNVLSYYYGKFYKRDAYNRWSDCRKARTRRCIHGERIFTGWRQQELISRLKSKIPKEAHDSLVGVFKSFSNGQASFENFVFALKSIIGTKTLVEAVAIGKGKHDLTGFVLDPSKPNQVLSFHPDMPTGKDCSSLASEDIIKFLTGDFRRSKTRSNDLFWEAVWPRLLARGWHSEQPKDVSTAKNCLVFLVPGIKKFSRSKLTKGTHYFDSISDVLKKVVADPVLLDLEVDGMDNGVTTEKNGYATEMKLDQDGPLDGFQELPKFTIIDTTLVQGEEPFKVRELRNLPADANISFAPLHRSHNMVSLSSSEEQDLDGRSLNDQVDCGRGTTDANDIEMVSAYNTGKQNQVDLLQNVVPCSVFPVNGHSSNGNSEKIGSTNFFCLKTKSERRRYLSPVSKRRRLSSCSNDQTTRRSISFSKGGSSEKEKIKPILASTKLTVVDVGGTCQTKAIPSCTTKEKPCEQMMDASNWQTRSNEKMNVVKAEENKSFERKVDAVAEVHPKITIDDTRFAIGAQNSSLVHQIKLETQPDAKTGTGIRITSSDKHGCMKAEEAPSISNSEMDRDVSEATGPVSPQPDLTSQVNSRRHGTRNRPPTARALEAVAFGLIGGGKRKGEPKSPGASRPPQRARKSNKDLAFLPTSGDTEKSSTEAEAQR